MLKKLVSCYRKAKASVVFLEPPDRRVVLRARLRAYSYSAIRGSIPGSGSDSKVAEIVWKHFLLLASTLLQSQIGDTYSAVARKGGGGL